MNIIFHKNFKKKYQKSTLKTQKNIKEKIILFQENKFSKSLNNHLLKGKYLGYGSLNVYGDLRIIYKEEKTSIIFVDLDNHNNLYK